MKTILIIFTLLFTFSCSSQNSNIHKSFKGNKVIIYDIKREGCPACKYQEMVFKTPEIKELLDKYCKVIYVDVYHQEILPKNWMHSNKTPTVHFVDANFNRLIPTINSVPPKEFKRKLLEAINKLKIN